MRRDSRTTGAFAFTGDWREFAPIAFTNLLLSVVTLGLYLFWARTRERRYLWSHTRFIDDRLEWTGTGLELLTGYVLAVLLFGVPFALINLVLGSAVMRGHEGIAALIGLALYLSVMSLTGIAIFRALRYRLSRTLWHGIRGGSDAQGFAFGWSYVWRTIVGWLPLGLLVPWSMTTLWNARFNAMSFGPHRFDANARFEKIMLRYLLFYLTPIILLVAGVVVGVVYGVFAHARGGLGSGTPSPQGMQTMIFAVIAIVYVLFVVVLGAIALIYYAAYFREAVGNTALGGLEFAFSARTWDWFRLFIGNFALVIFTLGLGYVFLGYRNWTFFVAHMEAYGTLDLDDFTQSRTRQPGTGEGLLDAFDVGAF